jgi:1,4-alpha-glucan branching enzyme
LERELADAGVEIFCVDQTTAHGRGAAAQLEPVRTAAGPVAVPIDWQTVELVWNEQRGYPVHDGYRDYHRRTVHDLKPWDNAGRPYDHHAAVALAAEHARDFVSRVRERLRHGGLLCCALDTELLGHWWYEGPAWLAAVLAEAERQGVSLVTVSEGIGLTEPAERALVASSWGAGKDLGTWDGPGVAKFAFGARRAELATAAAAAAGAQQRSSLERAARELLALQSSDWAFMATRDLAADYPLRRFESHRASHDAALAALTDSAPVAEPQLRNLAPDLDLATLTTP